MKRLRENDLDVDAPPEVPFTLPLLPELWLMEILPRALHFRPGKLIKSRRGYFNDFYPHQEAYLTRRALWLTCRWFYQHIPVCSSTFRDKTHDAFWPSVEASARRGYFSLLKQLDWPTHPHCQLDKGYDGQRNISYGRAGQVLARYGQWETLQVLLREQGQVWSCWFQSALDGRHYDLVDRLLQWITEHGPMTYETYVDCERDDETMCVKLLIPMAIHHHHLKLLTWLQSPLLLQGSWHGKWTHRKQYKFTSNDLVLAYHSRCPPLMLWYISARLTPTARLNGKRKPGECVAQIYQIPCLSCLAERALEMSKTREKLHKELRLLRASIDKETIKQGQVTLPIVIE